MHGFHSNPLDTHVILLNIIWDYLRTKCEEVNLRIVTSLWSIQIENQNARCGILFWFKLITNPTAIYNLQFKPTFVWDTLSNLTYLGV